MEEIKDFDATIACRSEVEELHRFFEDWFIGRIDSSDETFERFAGVLAHSFELIAPDGTKKSRDPLLAGLRKAHGFQAAQADVYRIRVEDVEARGAGEDLFIVTYEEWHESAAGAKGRRSTAIFRRDVWRPNGLEWLHVHETWIPADDEK